MTIKKLLKLIATMPVERAAKRICGEMIGSGLTRDVFELEDNRRYVVKIERRPADGYFSNACEWRNYIDNRHWTRLGPWLAPCEFISNDGRLLIQRRATIGDFDRYPKKIPGIFTDTKYQNFGFIGNQLVCVDYPFLTLNTSPALKTVKWWDCRKKV